MQHSHSDKLYTYSVDIAKAYPEDAAVESWVRDFRLEKKTNVLSVVKKYILKESKGVQQIVFMSKFKPQISHNNLTLLLEGKKEAIFEFKTKPKELKVEEIPVNDGRIERVWVKEFIVL